MGKKNKDATEGDTAKAKKEAAKERAGEGDKTKHAPTPAASASSAALPSPAPGPAPAATPKVYQHKVATKEDLGVTLPTTSRSSVSGSTVSTSVPSARGMTSKLFVRGLPEDATGDDVRTHGHGGAFEWRRKALTDCCCDSSRCSSARWALSSAASW